MTNANISAALAAAQAEMPSITKGGYNQYDKYSYAKLDDYVEAVKPVAAKHGLSIVVSVYDIHQGTRRTSRGNEESCVIVRCKGTILHTSGESIELEGIGEGQDRADKAVYKAITGARKYLLAQAFGLATIDDPESDESVGLSGRTKTEAPSGGVGDKPPSPKRRGVSNGSELEQWAKEQVNDDAKAKGEGNNEKGLSYWKAQIVGMPNTADLALFAKTVLSREDISAKRGEAIAKIIADRLRDLCPTKDKRDADEHAKKVMTSLKEYKTKVV